MMSTRHSHSDRYWGFIGQISHKLIDLTRCAKENIKGTIAKFRISFGRPRANFLNGKHTVL
jgi:hypothetical protein